MLLENKVALIYGAGGSVGGAVARAFAREGAQLFLNGRSRANVEAVAEAIRASGGKANTATFDALDEQAINSFADGAVEQAGQIDISFNLIGVGDVQKPLMEITVEEFLQPIQIAMRTQFLTSKAAARYMIARGSGVILAFGGDGPQTLPGLGGFKIALDALEGLRRQWAVELGAHGIRVITLKTGGIVDSLGLDAPEYQEIVAGIEQGTLLKRAARLADVGDVAAFAASDLARTITATDINISCGALMD